MRASDVCAISFPCTGAHHVLRNSALDGMSTDARPCVSDHDYLPIGAHSSGVECKKKALDWQASASWADARALRGRRQR